MSLFSFCICLVKLLNISFCYDTLVSIRGCNLMQLYELDTKITDKSYNLLDSYIKEQKETNISRINEIRIKCRNILEKNGIFEDRKNGIVYESMENELKKLAANIDNFNENNLEELAKRKIDNSIENITAKIDCLEQNSNFIYSNEEYSLNRASSENSVRNLLFNYFENYRANTIDILLKSGYSQNTIDNIEDDILEYTTSKNSDVLTEKFTQDGINSFFGLNESLNKLSENILSEAEARYNCQFNGIVYDELKEKRENIRQKVKKIEELTYQINSIEAKLSQMSGSSF